MSFWVSLYDDLFHPQADMRQMTGAELVEMLTTPVEAYRVWDKRTMPMWSPVLLNPARRAKRNVVSASCLVLDYDDGTPLDEATQTWDPWYRVLHTSWSHRPDHHKFRVVMPLSRDVTPEEYATLWRWAEWHCDRAIDKACKDISRAWLRPAVDLEDAAHQAKFDAGAVGGPLLDPDEVMPLAPPLPPRPKREPINLASLPDMSHLRGLHLDPASREFLGHELGGVVDEEKVRLVECPRCRRPSVWWWLDPDWIVDAMCTHKQSCGWKGPVAALFETSTDLDGALEQ